MTPAEFIAEVVEPTVREFSANPRSRRHAYLACIATFHVSDHLRRAGETGIEEKLRANGPAFFDAVHGVCNGAKHVRTGRGQRAAFAAGDDKERPAAMGGVAEGGISRSGDLGGREVDTPEGRVDLYEACNWVIRSYRVYFPHHFTGCPLDGL